MNRPSARRIVSDLLIRTEKGAFSNLALDGALRSSGLSAADRRFASRLFYGVLERKITLDHIIGCYSSRPSDKLDAVVLTALRMGVYQIVYCDNVPDRAAVSESVSLVKASSKKSASGFVNAVLRNIIRNNAAYTLPDDRVKAVSVEYSCGEDIVRLLLGSYPEEKVTALLKSSFETSDAVFRVNTLRTNAAQLADMLAENGISVSAPDIPVLRGKCLSAVGLSGVSADSLDTFGKGFFHIQDISSQLCCEALSPAENETIIDICAAPGGKSFTISQLMNGTGRVFSGDLRKKRTDIIRKGAQRLGLGNITAFEGDASVFDEKLPAADRVLCDVPCSGLGVMRGKPEIKYKKVSDFGTLPAVQSAILENASRYVKKGGVLVYSTCTLNPAENKAVTDDFLRSHPDFEGVPFLEALGDPFGGIGAEIFPDMFGSDGFYICKMMRKY